MSDAASGTGLPNKAAFHARSAGCGLAILAVAFLSACASVKRDSITVGAVPDDYRTNHPIVIAEKEQTLDLPIAASARGATQPQRASVEGFLANYDKSAAPVLTIMAPSGAANDIAAAEAANDFANVARSNGIPASRIMMLAYQADAEEVAAPVRISFSAMRAQTNRCGRWPKDILETSENKHYANFGCSYQNNIAAQIANPGDLLGPRKQTTIDADNRGVVIGDYQQGKTGLDSSSVDY